MKNLLIIIFALFIMSCDSEPYDPSLAVRQFIVGQNVYLDVKAESLHQMVPPGDTLKLYIYPGHSISVTNLGDPIIIDGRISDWSPAAGTFIHNESIKSIGSEQTLIIPTHQ